MAFAGSGALRQLPSTVLVGNTNGQPGSPDIASRNAYGTPETWLHRAPPTT